MRLFNFWPSDWHFGIARKSAPKSGGISASLRDSAGMGPWDGLLGKWQPRARSPYLLEALREAIPILDGGIGRMVTMDGIIEVEGGNDKLTGEIAEWMANVPVNDLETGYQAFYTAHGGEHYEQGIGIGEFVFDPRGRDVIGLRVADSKGICFARDDGVLRTFYRAPPAEHDHRQDGLGTVEALMRGNVRGNLMAGLHDLGFVELDPRQLVFALHKPEADNPYGTSLLRSMPFVAQILLKMENATGRAWERFGDPSFHVHYGTKNRKISAEEAQKRADTMAADLAKALVAKARGNSMDLATAAAADDEVRLEVIGAEGLVLEIEQPARHMLEQIVAGFGLPPWMLGITWSQAAGIGEQQSVVVLQESQTRFAVRKPQLRRPIEAMLRARGRSWKSGDWDIVQRLPNLMDEQKRAQAEFLRAQTALMLNDSGQAIAPARARGIDNNLRSRRRPSSKTGPAGADDGEGEPWAEADPSLPQIEAETAAALLAQWRSLKQEIIAALGLALPAGPAFEYRSEQTITLLALAERHRRPLAVALLDGQLRGWDRGVANAAAEPAPGKAGKSLHDDPALADAIARLREQVRASLLAVGLDLVRDGLLRTLQTRIVAALASGEFDGQNPINVAAELQRRFAAGEYNWQRLARSEIAMAQSDGKLDLYQQQGVSTVDYMTAGDSKVSAICRALAAAGPYRLGDAPVPVRDSHPNCRCTLLAVN